MTGVLSPAWSVASLASSSGTRATSPSRSPKHSSSTQGLQLITKLRKNMQNRLLTLADKLLLRKRALIETIHDQLKNICQIEHTRHRSPLNFLVHLLAGSTAYCHLPKKPSLHLDRDLLAVAAATVIRGF